MKNRFNLLIPLLVVLLASCGNSHRYVVDAVCPASFDGHTAYLYDAYANVATDSAEVRNGRFQLKGSVSDPYMGYLFVGGNAMALIVEPGHIDIDFSHRTLSGTPMNDDYASIEYAPAVSQCVAQIEQLISGQSDLPAAVLERRYDSLMLVQDSLRLAIEQEVVSRNLDNVLGVWLIYDISSSDKTFTSARLDSLLALSGEVVRRHPIIKELQLKVLSSVNNVYPDFEGIIFGINERGRLSQLIGGKVALIDFWASWCSPCCQEISENIVRIYEKYKDKGLMVVGVAVNDDPAKHAVASRNLAISYPQIIDDRGDGARLYGIDAIPYLVLVDADGVILSTGLRGAAIELAVREALSL